MHRERPPRMQLPQNLEVHEEIPNTHAKHMVERHPQLRLQQQGGHWVSPKQKGMGSWPQIQPCLTHNQNIPGRHDCDISRGQSELGFLFPAALPAELSAARYRQEGLSADYREDPEPAQGRPA